MAREIELPFVRSPYNYDRIAAADECCHKTFEPTLTVQSQRDEADINVIVKRYGLLGVMPENHTPPTYGDFSDVVDYKTAMDALAATRETFMLMPPEIRAKFDNDPQKCLEFCADANNVDAMIEMGFAVKRKQPDGQSNTNETGRERPSGKAGPSGKDEPAGTGAAPSGPGPGRPGPSGDPDKNAPAKA